MVESSSNTGGAGASNVNADSNAGKNERKRSMGRRGSYGQAQSDGRIGSSAFRMREDSDFFSIDGGFQSDLNAVTCHSSGNDFTSNLEKGTQQSQKQAIFDIGDGNENDSDHGTLNQGMHDNQHILFDAEEQGNSWSDDCNSDADDSSLLHPERHKPSSMISGLSKEGRSKRAIKRARVGIGKAKIVLQNKFRKHARVSKHSNSKPEDSNMGNRNDSSIDLVPLPAAARPRSRRASSSRRGIEHDSSQNVDVVSTQKSSTIRALANIVKCFVGSGIMGLPYAFKLGGIVLASLSLLVISLMATYCVYLLLDCKHNSGKTGLHTFGDVGRAAFGELGYKLVEWTLILAQTGFCCAYIIFIGDNLNQLAPKIAPSTFTIMFLPILIGLCWLKSLNRLAPFAMVANVLILAGVVIVMFSSFPNLAEGQMVQSFEWSSYPLFLGMAIYSFEGIGLALPIEMSMKFPHQFKRTWTLGTIGVTAMYIGFGVLCYSAYGDAVPPIITRSLDPGNPASAAVKLGLCIALLFTYPMMLFPVFSITEKWLPMERKLPVTNNFHGQTLNEVDPKSSNSSNLDEGHGHDNFFNCPALNSRRQRTRLWRTCLVLLTAVIALSIPDFGVALSFIGALPCNMMAFVLPAAFHLKLMEGKQPRRKVLVDLGIILFGIIAMVVCTSVTIGSLQSGQGMSPH